MCLCLNTDTWERHYICQCHKLHKEKEDCTLLLQNTVQVPIVFFCVPSGLLHFYSYPQFVYYDRHNYKHVISYI